MGGHHLIMGELTDRLTGRPLPDTHDERLRQHLLGLLLDQAGFRREEITAHHGLVVGSGDKRAVVYLDFLIRMSDRVVMVVKYGPGSIVTRHQPALAASRMVAPYQVPLVVVTNGRDADILDGDAGKIIGKGLSAIPSRTDVERRLAAFPFRPLPPGKTAMASRLVYAYEVDGSCPCDDTVCRIPPEGGKRV